MSRPSCILALPARRSINVVSRQRERTELCSRRRCPSHHCAHAHLALRVCTEQPSDTPACAWRSSRDWHRLRHGHVDGAAGGVSGGVGGHRRRRARGRRGSLAALAVKLHRLLEVLVGVRDAAELCLDQRGAFVLGLEVLATRDLEVLATHTLEDEGDVAAAHAHLLQLRAQPAHHNATGTAARM
jgi:hypothetical protein